MEGLPVVGANWVKRAGCRFSPKQVTPAPLSLAILELESEMRGHSLIPFLIDWKWWLWSVLSRMPPSPDPWLTQKLIQNGVFKFAANLKMAICRLWSLSFTRQLACWIVKYYCLQISAEPRCHRQLCRRLITNWLHLTIAIATWNSWLPPCHLNLLWTTSHLRFSSTAHFTCHLQLLAEDVLISLATAPSTCQNFHQILHWIEI